MRFVCNRLKSLVIGKIVLSGCLFSAWAKAAETLVESRPESVAFYRHLGDLFYAKKDYPRAIEEFERARVLTPQVAAQSLSLSLASAYYLAGKPALSEKVLQESFSRLLLRSCDKGESLCLEAKMLHAKSLLAIDGFREADAILNDLAKEADAPNIRVESFVLRGYALIQTGQIHEAAKWYATASTDLSPRASKEVVRLRQEIDKYQGTEPWNPTLATALSVVPGLGQAYLGEYGLAATSFVINSLAAYFAYDAWRKSEVIPGYSKANFGGWSLLWATFYSANFYSAGQRAKEKNTEQFLRLKGTLRNDVFSPYLDVCIPACDH